MFGDFLPPNHKWIAGLWKQFNEGWVYLPGFWSAVPEGQLKYISVVPPDSIQQSTENLLGSDYFWSPGYWSYDTYTQKYSWLSGRWIRFDPNWILVPAHYIWRPEGYIFVEAYWDLALKDRGIMYASLFIPQEIRKDYVYQPVVVDSATAIQSLFVDYPDYLYFYAWHTHFFPEFWIGFKLAPPWWNWDGWWAIDNQGQWSLWWWWSHPGYPAPKWINTELASKIVPPTKELIQLMKNESAPSFVLSKGVVSPNDMVRVLSNKLPIIPANSEKMTEITQALEKNLPKVTGKIRPTGAITPAIANLPIPKLTEMPVALKEINLLKIPEKPQLTDLSEVYRERPESDSDNVKPQIKRAVYPAKRPNLDMQHRKTKDVFKPTTPQAPSYSTPTLQRQDRTSNQNMFTPSPSAAPVNQRPVYTPPVTIQPTSPYGETRRQYAPSSSSYEAPRTQTEYRPPSYIPTRSSPTFGGDMYTPPSTSSYQPRESIRKPTPQGDYFSPTINIEGSQNYNSEEEVRAREIENHRTR